LNREEHIDDRTVPRGQSREDLVEVRVDAPVPLQPIDHPVDDHPHFGAPQIPLLQFASTSTPSFGGSELRMSRP
jgi:hypothetical protein